jgi:hypothetical protein
LKIPTGDYALEQRTLELMAILRSAGRPRPGNRQTGRITVRSLDFSKTTTTGQLERGHNTEFRIMPSREEKKAALFQEFRELSASTRH